jgi:hypothetical protein
MKSMSFIPRLCIALSVALVLASVGAISLNAQTPTENSSTSTAATAASTNAPKAIDSKTSEVTDNVDTVRVTVSSATAKPINSPETPVPQDQDKWQFQFSPYFWLAGLQGTGGVGNRTATVGGSFSDVIGALNFAFMGTFEARKGKFISLTDLEYVSVSAEKATPGPLFSTVDAGFKTFIFDQEVGYRLLENPEKGASLEVLGGARIWHVSTDFEFGAGILPATRIEGSRTWVDAVGGLLGKTALTQKMFLIGKFDLGGGGSKFTWQVFGGAGYSVNPKIALIFGYRVLDVDYDKNNFVYDMNQRGPILGLGFKF